MMYDLLLGEHLVYVHDDLNPWASLGVGFNEDKELVIELSFRDYKGYSMYPRPSFDKRIIIGRQGTEKLIDRLHTSLLKLPKAFAYEFGYRDESWSAGDAFDVFNEILNYLSSLNIQFRIEKKFKEI